jgi:pilus assembly protein CpaB
MNRNTRTIIVLLVALAVAGFASYAVYVAVQRATPKQEVEKLHAVVAAKPLPVGDLLTADDVKLVVWPSSSPIPGSFTSIEQVTNRGLVQSLAENEPLTEAKLAKAGAGAGLPPTIPPGMRALSVRVNEVVGVAGFVVPGNRVDVLVSINPGQASGQPSESVTRVIVSNVQVLTAGTRYDQDQARQEGQPIPTSVVTLLLTPEDAERVTLAADEGRIMLTLRNPLDVAPTVTPGARRGSLFTGGLPPPAQPPPGPVRRAPRAVSAPAPQAPKPYTVETIRAAKRAEETIR